MTRVALFGATGSIGRQTLDIIRAHPFELELVCAAVENSIDQLQVLSDEFPETMLAVSNADRGVQLRARLDKQKTVFVGPQAMHEALNATCPDIAVVAVSGMAGLPLLAECIRAHIPVALANKESIVAGGSVISDLRTEECAKIIPLDSEHAALYQCLGDSFDTAGVERFWITASGGPFRLWPASRLGSATPAEALSHPTWYMGRKITIDCATLANKGLEVIEACYLFSMPQERIRIVIQPQSIIHSMVEFRDTSVVAQLAPPDMRVPIRRALLGPGAYDGAGAAPIDFWKLGSIEFEKPDTKRFPCLDLAYEALRRDETAVFSAADEVAALSFGAGQIPFTDIPRLIEAALDEFTGYRPQSVPDILNLDQKVRQFTEEHIRRISGKY